MKIDMTDKIITVHTILNVPKHVAFEYFADNELLVKWLTVKADVEMKEGGKYELFWTPDDPDPTNNSTYGCKVLAVDRPHYFNIEWKGNAEQKEFMNTVHPLTNVTVLFSDVRNNKTKVTLIHTGWREGEKWEQARQYFITAWTGAFKQLEKVTNTTESKITKNKQVMESNILGLRTVIYKVADLNAAKEWYTTAFQTEPYYDESYYVGFNIGGFELGLLPDSTSAQNKTEGVVAYWGVEDIESEYNRIIDSGATAYELPKNVGGEIMVATVKDPWGNVIGLIFNPVFEIGSE